MTLTQQQADEFDAPYGSSEYRLALSKDTLDGNILTHAERLKIAKDKIKLLPMHVSPLQATENMVKSLYRDHLPGTLVTLAIIAILIFLAMRLPKVFSLIILFVVLAPLAYLVIVFLGGF